MTARPALVALAVAVAMGALFALALGRIGSSAEEESNRPAATQRLGTAAATTGTAAAREGRRSSGRRAARESGTRLPSWRGGEEAHTVVLYAAAERGEAESRARSARAAGIPAGVLRSDDHGTLEPGFWIVWAGRFDGEAEAEAAAEEYGTLGYAGGYVALVGD